MQHWGWETWLHSLGHACDICGLLLDAHFVGGPSLLSSSTRRPAQRTVYFTFLTIWNLPSCFIIAWLSSRSAGQSPGGNIGLSCMLRPATCNRVYGNRHTCLNHAFPRVTLMMNTVVHSWSSPSRHLSWAAVAAAVAAAGWYWEAALYVQSSFAHLFLVFLILLPAHWSQTLCPYHLCKRVTAFTIKSNIEFDTVIMPCNRNRDNPSAVDSQGERRSGDNTNKQERRRYAQVTKLSQYQYPPKVLTGSRSNH